jgi:hypothetical protein
MEDEVAAWFIRVNVIVDMVVDVVVDVLKGTMLQARLTCPEIMSSSRAWLQRVGLLRGLHGDSCTLRCCQRFALRSQAHGREKFALATRAAAARCLPWRVCQAPGPKGFSTEMQKSPLGKLKIAATSI